MKTTREQVLDYLAEVKDPEIPVLDVVEMGIVRDARLDGDTLHVDITPTYSGCPAMKAIEEEIVRTLHARGFENVVVHTVFR
ncbi:metal-sulfur cluster assembly factor, partial [Rhodocaloribacter sp.]